VEYSYKIIRSDIGSNMMEVEYSSAGFDTLLVGMPLPVEGQHHLDIIRAYSPVHHWTRSKLSVVDAPVGETGTIVADVGLTASEMNDRISEDALMREDLRRNELKALIQSVIAEMSESTI
jgi:hypothetical protein